MRMRGDMGGSKFAFDADAAMEDGDPNDSLRRQVVETTDLLLKAVDKLDQDARSTTTTSTSRPLGPGSFREPSSLGTRSTSQRLEMSRLFNWSGIGAKRKHAIGLPAGGRTSKKKKLQMYAHTFCCLAHTSQQ